MTPEPRSISRTTVFIAMCLAIFSVSLETTIVATALPTIVADLGGLRDFSWVFGAYLLTSVLLIPIYGRLADFYGRKKLLTSAICVFTVGSCLCGFAHSMTQLILFRALQGIGAGGTQPIAVTIVGDMFRGHERARAQSIMSSIWGGSAIVGPILGAFIVAHFGWAFIFWINIPFSIACVTILWLAYHEKVPQVAHRIDYVGSLMLALGVASLMFALVTLRTVAPAISIGLFVFAAVMTTLLLAHQRRAPEPMLPLQLYRIRIIVLANACNFLIGAMVMGLTAFLPTYVQGALGEPPVVAGSVLGSYLVFWTCGTVTGARMQLRYTYREIAGLGGVMLIIGTLALIAYHTSEHIVLLYVSIAPVGLGFGLINSILVIGTQSAVDWQWRGAATSSNVFMRQIGNAIGSAGFAAVFNLVLYARIPNAEQTVADILTPGSAARIPASALARDAAAIAAAMHGIYLIQFVMAVGVLGLVLSYPPNLRTVRATASA